MPALFSGLQPRAIIRCDVSLAFLSFRTLASLHRIVDTGMASEQVDKPDKTLLFAPIGRRPAQTAYLADSTAAGVMAGSKKLTGWEWYRSINSPKYFVAPMVQHSELAFRLLTREYGAHVTVTPMIHARIFLQSPKFRRSFFDFWPEDSPMIAQFCGNDPETVVAACKLVQHRCTAVDLNLGCPQNIAKRGNYGSFLLEDADTVVKIVEACAQQLSVPVTCKIRIQENFDATLDLVHRITQAGASLITVHGRTRHENKLSTREAHWDKIAAIKQVAQVPIIANGGMFDREDIRRCLQETAADGVMLSEAILDNPGVFTGGVHLPTGRQHNVVDMAWRYLEIAEAVGASWQQIQGHLVKMLYGGLALQRDLQDRLCKGDGYFTFDSLKDIVRELGLRYGVQVQPLPVEYTATHADTAHGDRILWWKRFHAHNLELKKHHVHKRDRAGRAAMSRAVDSAASQAELACFTSEGQVLVPLLPAASITPPIAMEVGKVCSPIASTPTASFAPAGTPVPMQHDTCPAYLARELAQRTSGDVNEYEMSLQSRAFELAFPNPGLWYYRHAPRIVAAALAPCASLAMALVDLAEQRSAQHHTHVLRDVEALKIYLREKHGARLAAAHAAEECTPRDILADAVALPIMSCEEATHFAASGETHQLQGHAADGGGDAIDQLTRDSALGVEALPVGIAGFVDEEEEFED